MKFNSLKYAKRLRSAGFSENQSEIIADGFHEHISYADVAKKNDLINLDKKIQLVETNLNNKINLVETNLNNKIDIVEMKLEKSIADLGTKLTTFICVSSFSLMAVLLSFMAFLHGSK